MTHNSSPITSIPLVIVNRASAGGATAGAWSGIASDLRTHFGPFECAFTERAGHAEEIAEASARDGRRLIIACGGDGTISEVANGIMRSEVDAELGILPSGTGGDFRRTLEIPSRAADAARILRTGRSRSIDIGRVTCTGENGETQVRYFVGVASFGMSGEVIARAKEEGNRWLAAATPKWLSGRLSYAAATVRTAIGHKGANVAVRFDDGDECRLTIRNLCVANARYFGGGMKIAPEALLNDGRFDVIAIGDLSAAEILANGLRLYTGTHLSLGKVSHRLASKVDAYPANDGDSISVELDGEVAGILPAKFEVLPGALEVRCPK